MKKTDYKNDYNRNEDFALWEIHEARYRLLKNSAGIPEFKKAKQEYLQYLQKKSCITL